MKGGKESGFGDIVVRLSKYGGDTLILWLLRIFNKYTEKGTLAKD